MENAKKLLETFISQMNAIHKKHEPFAAPHEVKRVAFTKTKMPSDPEEAQKWSEENRRLSREYDKVLQPYVNEKADLLDRFGIKYPDYFRSVLSWTTKSRYADDVIVGEKVVNKNKVKLFTEGNKGNIYTHRKVFTLCKNGDEWMITKVASIEEDTGKEVGMEW